MQQPPVEFSAAASSHRHGGRAGSSQPRPSVEPEASSSSRGSYLLTLKTSLVLVALACLGLFIAARLPHWDTLFTRPSLATEEGDPILAGMLQWVPILLIMVSSAVLALMAVLSLRERRAPRRANTLELVPPPAQASTQPLHAAVEPKSESRPETVNPRPFLVSHDDHRHQASEEMRLDRDARASAAQRSAAVSRLRIMAVTHPNAQLEAPDPVARRSFMRRKTFRRDKAPTPITATLNRKTPDQLPPATA